MNLIHQLITQYSIITLNLFRAKLPFTILLVLAQYLQQLGYKKMPFIIYLLIQNLPHPLKARKSLPLLHRLLIKVLQQSSQNLAISLIKAHLLKEESALFRQVLRELVE
jgi:hypothetical protein